MKDRNKLFNLKNTITIKSLSVMILFSTAVLLGMEIINFYHMNIYEKQIVENYNNSLKMYCSYWDNKLEIVNNSLLALTNPNTSDGSYWNVCNSKNGLFYETSKTMLVNRMSEIAWNHQNEVMVFTYVPARNVFLKSNNHLVGYAKRLSLSENIKKYADNIFAYNSDKWRSFRSDSEDFFIQVYKADDAYVGALLKTQSILNGIVRENGVVSSIGLKDGNGKQVFLMQGDLNVEKNEDTVVLNIPMNHIGGKLSVIVMCRNLFIDKISFIILSLVTVVLGALLLAGNIRFQVKNVLGPLNKLKNVMEDFSQGNLDIRLDERGTKKEIGILFHTFNEMVQQISNLKIDVYEAKLDRARIESNYLKVQIQPHFYINILNLICGLAQLKDFKSIQKLAMTTGSYFRYLLAEKGSFVLLSEEIACVRNYIQIQQLRYKGELEFEILVEKGAEKQLVLPMILQTFTENSVKHNITLVPLLHLAVNITFEQDKLFITVCDNGAGFDEEILKKINNDETISQNGEHIGITNIKERIRLFYGDAANVMINSRPGKTEVQVTLPIIDKKNHQL